MKRWKWLGLGAAISIVIVCLFMQLRSDSSDAPVRRVGCFESRLADVLARIGICHAWVAEVQSRESFIIIDIDPAAMEFDVDLNAIRNADR